MEIADLAPVPSLDKWGGLSVRKAIRDKNPVHQKKMMDNNNEMALSPWQPLNGQRVRRIPRWNSRESSKVEVEVGCVEGVYCKCGYDAG